MPTKVNKRPAREAKGAPAKRHKPNKGKDKAADRGHIPIPTQDEDENTDLSDQDLEVLTAGASFLSTLDHAAISRSKKETIRLHRLSKPMRQQHSAEDGLPSIQSHSEDEQPWSSGIDSSGDEHSASDAASDSNTEMHYEKFPRRHGAAWSEGETQGVQRLPIKLSDGRVVEKGRRLAAFVPTQSESESEDELSVKEDLKREDVSTAARFGRPAVVDVIKTSSRRERIQAAKDQIASICQDIISDPENGLGLLKRLNTFTLSSISTPSQPQPIENDVMIRKLAFLSQLAVFKDIIPGYSIRPLTEKEKAEKVSQSVARTREWEQGLVAAYSTYLRALEAELKAHSELSDVALQSICTLLTEVTHFNFRSNLMNCVVAQLSKKTWNRSFELCLNSLVKVFRADLTGVASLEIVRLLNRMIKGKKFKIHPAVLGCLLHLRLKTELGTRASESKADKEPEKRSKEGKQKAKGSERPHLSKKARKVLKERKEIQREFREAEAEVDKEEREANQTETLKLLFILYFRILKQPTPTPLLVSALEGVAKYAHLVNIDFFRDLMTVLRTLIAQTDGQQFDDNDVQLRLMCIVTAFELLTGQGEALNIDLDDFVVHLYALIPRLVVVPNIDVPLASFVGCSTREQSLADLLFRALNIVFSPRTFGASAPTWRSAAFAKRLLSSSLHWPSAAVLPVLDFVGNLVNKDSKLKILLSTEDRIFDGVYRADVDDPQICNPMAACLWEVYALKNNHWDSRVRDGAGILINMILT